MPDTKSPSQSPGANCTVTSNTWKSLHLRWALRWDWWISLGPAGGVGRVELMWQRPTGLPYETLGLSKGSGWFNCGKLAGNMSRLVILNLKNTRNSESEPSTYIHLHDFGFNMLSFHGYTLRLKLTVTPPLNISRILKRNWLIFKPLIFRCFDCLFWGGMGLNSLMMRLISLICRQYNSFFWVKLFKEQMTPFLLTESLGKWLVNNLSKGLKPSK